MCFIKIEELIGKTFTAISGMEKGSEKVHFESESASYAMYHDQDCCEHVDLDDVCGDVADLIGSPILEASEESSTPEVPRSEDDESFTWTFYRLATIKGTVTLKWYGASNGYYSEGVSIRKL